MKVTIQRLALQDLTNAARFWERQQVGLGSKFIDELSSELESLAITGGVHAKQGNYHRAVISGRFPYYSVFYRINGEKLDVVALIDTRRDPSWVRSFLTKRLL